MAGSGFEPSEASWYDTKRNKGLTREERACFGRYSYRASEEVDAKMARRSSGGNRRVPQPLTDMGSVASNGTGVDGFGSGFDGFGGASGMDDVLGYKEDVCSQILDRLLPVPERKQMAPGRRNAIASFSTPAGSGGPSNSGVASGAGGGLGATGATSSGGKTPGSLSGTGRLLSMSSFCMDGTSNSGAAPPATPQQRPHMIKRAQQWEDRMHENVIRLVQGACANKVEREVGGVIRFVHTKVSEDDAHDVASFNEACVASGSKRAPLPKLPHQEKVGNANTGYKKGAQETLGHPLQEFRKRMLSRFLTAAEAFDSINVDRNAKLDMREWCDCLVKTGLTNMFEARVIFELMDADRDGTLTLNEFNVGIETIAPVKTFAALRKRFVCLGFTSMLQAIAVMDGGGEDTTLQPLTLSEFSAAMRRAWVIEDDEHRTIFNLVRDPSDPSGKASLSDLACGLAAVSPCMLIAEARSQLIIKWGSLENAYAALKDEWLDSERAFTDKGSEWLGMTRREAGKIFRFTDIDQSGNLSRAEVMGVLRLSQASIAMEDTRRVVQQSYRGIEAALREGLTQGSDLDDSLRFNVEEILELLEPVDMPKAEKRRLTTFLCATSDQGMTLCEFFRGIRLFAPSCMLEGVRLQILRTHERVVDAFKHVRNRRQPMGRPELKKLLQQAGAPDIPDFDTIFDILDVRSSGFVTVSELVCALRGSESGTRRWLADKEREESVEQRIRGELAPLRGDLSELRLGLRRGLQTSPTFVGSRLSAPASLVSPAASNATGASAAAGSLRLPRLRAVRSEPTMPSAGNFRSPSIGSGATAPTRGDEWLSVSRTSPSAASSAAPWSAPPGASSAARSSSDRVAVGEYGESPPSSPELNRLAMRKTFQKLSTSLEALPEAQGELRRKAMDSMTSYFTSHQRVFQEQEPLLKEKLSKSALYSEMTDLRRASRGGRARTLKKRSSSMMMSPTLSAVEESPKASGSTAAAALRRDRSAGAIPGGGARATLRPLS